MPNQRMAVSRDCIPPVNRGAQTKWMPMYVAASSIIIVTLLCTVLFRSKPPVQPAAIPISANRQSSQALSDAKKMTEELKQQQDLQSKLAERSRLEDAARKAVDEQRRIADAAARKAELERQEKESRQSEARSRVASLDMQIRRLEDSLEETQAASAELKTNVENFILDHKMATAALALGLGGTGVALDSSNNFSDDAKALGALGAVAVGFWLFSDGDNIKEVIHVGSELTKASNSQDRYLSTTSSLQAQIAQKKAEKSRAEVTMRNS